MIIGRAPEADFAFSSFVGIVDDVDEGFFKGEFQSEDLFWSQASRRRLFRRLPEDRQILEAGQAGPVTGSLSFGLSKPAKGIIDRIADGEERVEA